MIGCIHVRYAMDGIKPTTWKWVTSLPGLWNKHCCFEANLILSFAPQKKGCAKKRFGIFFRHRIVFLDVCHRIHGTGIFTYIWLNSMVNVGKYTIHGSYGSLTAKITFNNNHSKGVQYMRLWSIRLRKILFGAGYKPLPFHCLLMFTWLLEE